MSAIFAALWLPHAVGLCSCGAACIPVDLQGLVLYCFDL